MTYIGVLKYVFIIMITLTFILMIYAAYWFAVLCIILYLTCKLQL